MEPKISVIIPAYKVEPYLRQCLDSVVNQTYRNLEIIIIDDGSPDNCGAICDEYAAKDDRITVAHKENGGLSAGWNDGIEKATGEWIAFVDSDDWIELDYFESLIKGTGTKADIVMASGFFEEGERKRIQTTFNEPFTFQDSQQKDTLKIGIVFNQGHVGFTYVWNKLYRSAFIKREGLKFDTRIRAGLANDGVFNFVAYEKASSVVGLSYMGYHYRITKTSGSLKYSSDLPDAQHYVVERYYTIAEAQNAPPAVFKAIEACVFIRIGVCFRQYYFHPDNSASYSEISRQIAEMKKKPYFSKAIWGKENQYLSAKQKVLKFALRLPWIWPLKLLYDLNEEWKDLVNS